MKKITQKQLIDYCNSTPWDHCYICPYEGKECKAYCAKYGDVPGNDDFFHPERYTDKLRLAPPI